MNKENMLASFPMNGFDPKAFDTSGLNSDWANDDYGTLPTLKVKNQTVHVMAGENSLFSRKHNIEIVIVNRGPVGRVYYASEFDPKADTAPDCYSVDGTKPSKFVENPVCANCSSCPNNVAGSGKRGESRACRFRRNLAVIVPAFSDTEIVRMSLPPTSCFSSEADEAGFSLKCYEEKLKMFKLQSCMVLTLASINDSKCLKFQPIETLSKEQFLKVCELSNTDAAKEAVDIDLAKSKHNPGVGVDEDGVDIEATKKAEEQDRKLINQRTRKNIPYPTELPADVVLDTGFDPVSIPTYWIHEDTNQPVMVPPGVGLPVYMDKFDEDGNKLLTELEEKDFKLVLRAYLAETKKKAIPADTSTKISSTLTEDLDD